MLPVTSFPLDLVWLSVTRSLLTPCTLTHRSRRTMLSSNPLPNWHEASWAALTQSGVLEWVWQVSTLAPSIFLLSADPLETISSSNKYHWHCPWSGLQRWVWLEAKLPHVSQMRVRYWRESGCYVLACLPGLPDQQQESRQNVPTRPYPWKFHSTSGLVTKGCWNDFLEFRLLNIRNKKGIKMP